MSSIAIPQNQWSEFLQAFTRRHLGWLVRIDTHDVETAEDVASRFMPLNSIELDVEDEKNPRIKVVVLSDAKEIQHILFQPSMVVLYLSADGAEEALRIESLNTSTTVRFRAAANPELVDQIA